jgi:hypothetical protein
MWMGTRIVPEKFIAAKVRAAIAATQRNVGGAATITLAELFAAGLLVAITMTNYARVADENRQGDAAFSLRLEP